MKSPLARFGRWPLRVATVWMLSSTAMIGTSLAADTPMEIPTRVHHIERLITVAEDGSYVEEADWSMSVLQPQALESAKQASIGYSTSMQTAEILHAYTIKPDGARVDAPKSNYQTRSSAGRNGDAPVFSDRSSISVVFPDVAVGDTVHFAYRLTTREPLFPGHFSTGDTYSRETALDRVRVRVDTPAALWVQYRTKDMKQTVTETPEGRRIIEWTYSQPDPVAQSREDYSVYDPDAEPGYAISSFRSYADVARAYGERAVPKAAVTPRIEALAREIVGNETDPRGQARAIYTWVVKNITYGGNCIGIGAVVPHDLDFVLDNRMGDCKDHATLLDALLGAQGIDSDQALINAGSVYTLPEVPVVSMVNHVINYLPGLDLYLDATSKTTAFGMLPWGDEDKPVLLVEHDGQQRRTPATAPGTNTQSTHATIVIGPDGRAHSTVEVALTGRLAEQWRAWLRDLPRQEEDKLVDNLLRGQGLTGEGIFEKDDPKPLESTFNYRFELDFGPLLNVPGTGAFHIDPGVFSPAPVASLGAQAFSKPERVPTACSNLRSSEIYEYRFPDNVAILAVPKNIDTGNETVHYRATYELDGQVLKVERVVDDRTPGNVCSPELIAQQRVEFEKLAKNVRMQVLYSAE